MTRFFVIATDLLVVDLSYNANQSIIQECKLCPACTFYWWQVAVAEEEGEEEEDGEEEEEEGEEVGGQ